jgi:hypothetical protein
MLTTRNSLPYPTQEAFIREPDVTAAFDAVWEALSDAIAKRLSDTDATPENLRIVALVLLVMSARTFMLAGLTDPSRFRRAAEEIHRKTLELMETEESPEQLRRLWMSMLSESASTLDS